LARTDLSTRLLSAGLLAPLLLVLLFRGSPDAWSWLVLAATALATLELVTMTHPGDRVAQIACTLTSMGVCWVVYHHDQNPQALLGVLLVLPVLGLLLALCLLSYLPSAALRAMSGVAAPLYIGGLLGSLALLRRDAGELGPFYVLLVLKLSWLPDTGGFFAGRYLGKHSKPLAPRVSPKKTQIGFVGSLVGAALGVLIAKFWYLRDVPLLELLLLGLVAGTLGQLGDLAESLIKRSAGIKDSGNLIPGHGGLLDRIDALLLVSPVLYMYAVWWR
jgi:phosphatidate cytidylyltransferase